MILTLKLHNNNEVKLKLKRAERFKGWGNYEIVVRYESRGFWVSVYFKIILNLVKSRTVMTIDINFESVTLAVFTLNGKLVKLEKFKTSHRKILTHRI